MQKLQDEANFGCVESKTCINIAVLASNVVGASLNHTLASATEPGRSKELELTLTLRHRNVLPEDDASNRLRENTLVQNTASFLFGTSR